MPTNAPAALFPRGLISCLVIVAALGFGAAGNVRADDGAAGVDDITLEAGFAKFTIKHLDLTSSSLSGPEFKALLEGLATGVSAGSLAKLDAASIVIPDLAMEQTLGAIHQEAHYLNVRLTGIHAGKVGAYSIASATIGGEMATGQMVTGVMHGIGGTDIDLPELMRVFTETSTDASAPLKPLYGTPFVDGYEFKTPLVDFSLGKATMSDIRGRPLTKSLADLPKTMPAPKAPGQPLSPEEQKSVMTFMSSIFDLYGAFSVGAMDMRDLKITGHGDAEHQVPPFSASISRMTMTGYANSRIGEMSLEGLDVTPPQGKFHLGKFSLKGFDFSDWLTSMSQLMQKMAADPAGAAIAPTDLPMKMPRIEAISLSGVAAEYPMPTQTGDAPAPMHLSLANLEIRPGLSPTGLPISFASTIDHLAFSLPPNLPNSDALGAAGIETVDLSSKFDAQWDEAAQRLTIDTAMIEAKDLGKLTMAVTADNIPPEAFTGDQFTREAAWLGAQIKSADIQLDNEKFLDAVIEAQAKQTGKSASEAKSELIAAASMGIPNLLGNSPAAKALADAVAKFIANPKSLHIAVSSSDGIGASDMAAPDQVLGKVDLTATANE